MVKRHARGPWKVGTRCAGMALEDGGEGDLVSFTPALQLPLEDAHGVVAWVVTRPENFGDDEATARLIAMAPELKIACEGALVALTVDHVDKRLAIDFLREVLAKVADEETGTVKCPKCGEVNRSEINACRFPGCGVEDYL